MTLPLFLICALSCNVSLPLPLNSDEQIKLVEYESTLELIQSKIREVKRLKTEVIDFVEIEELSSFHRKAMAEALITKMQVTCPLCGANLANT